MIAMYVFYLRHNEDDIDLLFHLLRVYNTRQVVSLHFLSRFLEDSVIKVCNEYILYDRLLLVPELFHIVQEENLFQVCRSVYGHLLLTRTQSKNFTIHYIAYVCIHL